MKNNTQVVVKQVVSIVLISKLHEYWLFYSIFNRIPWEVVLKI